MPKWWVSEPWINLWLKDTPLFYQPSRGKAIEFRLLFKNRLNDVDNNLYNDLMRTDVFSFGQNWTSPWRRFVKTNVSDGSFNFFNGRGGEITINDGANLDYRWRIGLGKTSLVPHIDYPSGARDTYNWYFAGADGVDCYFLTSQQDRFGNTTSFTYTNSSGVACLTSITDVDSKVTTLTYTNVNGYALVSQVTDPNGHTVTMQYDAGTPAGPPYLTNIVDAAGLSSSMAYDESIGLTNLTTPYGTTTFTVNNTWIHVNELGVRDHLYLYVGTGNPDLMTNSYSAWAPSSSPFANTFDTANSDLRNSFYWGPRQYALLPADFVAALTNATPSLDPNALYGTNYLQARQRHWLLDASEHLGQTLSLERAASPDTVTQGQITWYDYAGKSDAEHEGTMILPLLKAWKLPNGESRFVRSVRNPLGPATNVVETYSDGSGTLHVRTNILVYSTDNIDLLAVTNALGVRAVSNVFNAYHQVVTNFNALDEMTVYTYDGNTRLTSVKAPAGLTTTNLYGADNYLSQTIDLEIGRTNSYTWTNGLVYSHTDERGLTVTNTWDGLNRLRKVTYPDGTFVTNAYSKLDLVATIDRMNFTNRYEYNGFRQKVAAIDALNRTNYYSYCDCGVLSSIIDPLNQTTSFIYDYNGRKTVSTYPDGFSITNRYDLMGRLTNVIDSAGSSVTNWFNNQGLTVAVSNAVGRVKFIQFDALDRATNAVNANGVTVAGTYDNLYRMLTRSYPDGGVEKFGYSAMGLVAYTNQLNQTNFYAYDVARRKTFETNANYEITQFKYDSSSNLTNLIDRKSQTTTWNYNEYGLVTNKVDAAGNVLFMYQYDPNQRLTNRGSLAKGTTVYRYDKVGNLTNVDYAVSSDITLKYDALNRLTNMVDAAGTTIYGYTTVGALLSEDGPWANDTVSYAYDNERRRSGLTLLTPNAPAWTQNYDFDAASRMTNVTSPAGAFTYQYDLTRKLEVSKLTLPNTSYITNSYDNVSRRTSTFLKSSGDTVLNTHTYGHNTGSQRTQQVFTANNYVDYTYDNIGQLQTAKGKESGGVTNRLQEQLSYVYDAADNLIWRTNNALVQAFNVNNLNELTITTNTGTLTVAGTTTGAATNVTVNTSNAVLYLDNTFAKDGFTVANGNNTYQAIAKDIYGRSDTNAITVNLPATNTYSYDLNGNLTSDGTRGFDYDDENQIIRVTVTNAWKSEFTYDGKWRRRIRKEYTWQSSAWLQTNEVRYVYDGNLVIQERDANNIPTVSYTRGKDLSGSLQRAGGIGGLLARTDNGSQLSAFYHADGSGNITALINENQRIVAKYLYDPFGNILSMSGPLADKNVYRFSSKEYHPNSGLIYYLYRYYDPNLQRWVNRDPIQEQGGYNLYRFVSNDPQGQVDPFGDMCLLIELLIVALVGIGIAAVLLKIIWDLFHPFEGHEDPHAPEEDPNPNVPPPPQNPEYPPRPQPPDPNRPPPPGRPGPGQVPRPVPRPPGR